MRRLLSIVVPAHNKPEYVVAALESILRSIGPSSDVEICVSDNTGATAIHDRLQSHPTLPSRVRYRQSDDAPTVDQNFVAAAAMAQGDYVWIFGDDDLLEEDAIATVLDVIRTREPGIIVVNSQSFCGAEIVEGRRLAETSDRYYAVGDDDRFMIDLAGYLTFVSALVIKKQLWDDIDKRPWMGSSFVHLGTVLALKPTTDAYVVSKPIVRMRVGSQTWSADYFRIWQVSFPALIWNAAYTDAAKATVVTQAPLKSVARMAVMRAYGYLNWPVFRQFIAGNRELGALSRWSSMLLCLIPVSVMRWSYIAVLKAGLRPRTRNFSPEAALKWLRQPGRAVGR